MGSEWRFLRGVLCLLLVLSCAYSVSAEEDEQLKFGEIAVSSTPEGAAIYVDGKDTGYVTNRRIMDLMPGVHTVLVTYPGYRDDEKIVDAIGGERVFVNFELKPKIGSLTVSTEPEGAKIYVDGYCKGTSDTLVSSIPEGTHTVMLSLDGYRSYSKQLQVEDGDTLHMSHTFEPLPTTGTVVVNCTPDGAWVYIDDVCYGISRTTICDLDPGSHEIRLKKYGYFNWSSPFDIRAGEILEFNNTMEAKNGTVAIFSFPVRGEIFIDGVFFGSGPYEGGCPQGEHKLEVKAPGFEEYADRIQVPYDPISVPVTLNPLAPAAIVEAEEKIEVNRVFNPKNAEMELDSARGLLLEEKYHEAYLSALNASRWAEDVDGDGVPNSFDFWTAITNEAVYAAPFVLFVMIGGLVGFDWRRCRIRPDVDLWLDEMGPDGTWIVHVTPSVNRGYYLTMLCTVYLDDDVKERIVAPGKREVNLGHIPPGVHRIRAVVDVKQHRYGRSEVSKSIEVEVS